MPRITIIGTSHVAEKSIQDIQQAYKETSPDILAVELDRDRLEALVNKRKPNYSPTLIRKIGLAGYLFALVGGLLQRKFGRMVGTDPGSDMLAAINLAKDDHKPLLLIDQPLTITLKRLSKKLTRKEKWRLFTDIAFGWAKKQPKVAINLKSVPQDEIIATLMEQLKDRYPTFYEVLVHERNIYMARKLMMAAQANPDKHILTVIGAGHKEGLLQALQTTTFLNHQPKETPA